MENFSFEKLNAYVEARKLVVEVYKIINRLPQHEKFVLGTQLQRAIVSVPSNIAEGSGRISYKERIRIGPVKARVVPDCTIEVLQHVIHLTLLDRFCNAG